MLATQSPFPQYFDADGSPLDGGRLYFGQVNQNPETAPITVYWDAAGTQPAAQPVETLNGYTARNGTPAQVYAAADYSLTVRDRRGQLVFTAPNSAEFSLGSAIEGLRSDLSDASSIAKGDALIAVKQPFAGAVPITQHDKNAQILARSEFGSDAEFNAAKVGKPSLDATGRWRAPTFIAGTEEISGATLRDAFVVGRNVVGPTNCHGFADRTIMSGVTDGGFYGSYDCTVELQGSHTQNHVYAYQDRVRYAGSGTLTDSAGFLSQAVHSGSGTIANRNHILIDPMVVTGGGTIAQQTGIRINHLSSGANNVGLFIQQTNGVTGWAIYAPGSTSGVYPLNGAKSFHAGPMGFGMEPDTSVPISFKANTDSANAAGFLSSDLTRVTLGALGNAVVALVTNGQARVVVEGSAGGYALRPNGDNAQSSGSASFRWSVVYAGTGAINTSDERLKEQLTAQSAAEKAAALACKALIRKFKFKDAVAVKGSAARWHFGVSAQAVAAAFQAQGLNPANYGLFCYDEWPASPDGPAGNRYGIRYDELAMFILAAT